MIRTFEHPHSEWTEFSTVDTENGDLIRYLESDGMKFSEWHDNVLKIGWKSVSEFIKNRRNKAWGWKEVHKPEQEEK